MDRGAWWATVHGVAKESDVTERLKQSVHNQECYLSSLDWFLQLENRYKKLSCCLFGENSMEMSGLELEIEKE